MRETQLETPQKEQSIGNRRPKSIPDSTKKCNKIPKKNLIKDFSNTLTQSDQTNADSLDNANSTFPLSVSAPDLTPSSTLTTAGTQACIDSPNPVNMPLSLSFSESELTPSSSITISGTKVEGTGQTIRSGALKITSAESELVVKQLKESMVQVLNSRGVDSRSKKILDAVVNAVIEDLPGVGISDNDWFTVLASKKAAVVLLNFFTVITAIRFFLSGHQHAPFGLTPT